MRPMTYQHNSSDIAQLDHNVSKNESPSGTPADPIAVMSLATRRWSHGRNRRTEC